MPTAALLVRTWWLWALAALPAGAVTIASARGFPIVAFELAWTTERADVVLRGFDPALVRASIVWDFLFLLTYAPALALGGWWARSSLRDPWARKATAAIAIGGGLAGLLDAVENLAMLGHLDGWGGGYPLASLMAAPKFVLVGLATVLVLLGLVRNLLGPGSPSASVASGGGRQPSQAEDAPSPGTAERLLQSGSVEPAGASSTSRALTAGGLAARTVV